jgi:hypothetical protein
MDALIMSVQDPDRDRETLNLCPACGGDGQEELRTDKLGRYRQVPCKCCHGKKYVTRRRAQAYVRRLRIMRKKRLGLIL